MPLRRKLCADLAPTKSKKVFAELFSKSDLPSSVIYSNQRFFPIGIRRAAEGEDGIISEKESDGVLFKGSADLTAFLFREEEGVGEEGEIRLSPELRATAEFDGQGGAASGEGGVSDNAEHIFILAADI